MAEAMPDLDFPAPQLVQADGCLGDDCPPFRTKHNQVFDTDEVGEEDREAALEDERSCSQQAGCLLGEVEISVSGVTEHA